MTLGQTWVHINPTLGLNVVSLAENISKLDPIFGSNMGLYCGFNNSLFQHRLGITWEFFPFPNLIYYFVK